MEPECGNNVRNILRWCKVHSVKKEYGGCKEGIWKELRGMRKSVEFLLSKLLNEFILGYSQVLSVRIDKTSFLAATAAQEAHLSVRLSVCTSVRL